MKALPCLVLLLVVCCLPAVDEVVRYLQHLDAQPTKLLKYERGLLYIEAKIGEVSLGVPMTLRYASIPAGADPADQEALDGIVGTAVMTWLGGKKRINFVTRRNTVYLGAEPMPGGLMRHVQKIAEERLEGGVRKRPVEYRDFLSLYLVSWGLAVSSGYGEGQEDANFRRAMATAEGTAREEKRGLWATHESAMTALVEERNLRLKDNAAP